MTTLSLGTAVTFPSFSDPTLSDDYQDEDGEIGFDPLAPDEDAPYGYTIDRQSGERRAKKLPGRPGKTGITASPVVPGEQPTLEQLKAEKIKPEEDQPPAKVKRTRGTRTPREPVKDIPFKAGVIAKGMNRLYLRAGKIIKVWDDEIGTAIIECTRKETPDDVTVGEAWEELAKTNPRIRAFLMKILVGGAWSQLFMAHMPIFLAIIMKDSIRQHMPFGRLLDATLSEDSPGQPSQVSEALGGLTPVDVEQVMAMAQQWLPMFGANASGTRQPVAVPVEPE